jgi:hypothetical protein
MTTDLHSIASDLMSDLEAEIATLRKWQDAALRIIENLSKDISEQSNRFLKLKYRKEELEAENARLVAINREAVGYLFLANDFCDLPDIRQANQKALDTLQQEISPLFTRKD